MYMYLILQKTHQSCVLLYSCNHLVPGFYEVLSDSTLKLSTFWIQKLLRIIEWCTKRARAIDIIGSNHKYKPDFWHQCSVTIDWNSAWKSTIQRTIYSIQMTKLHRFFSRISTRKYELNYDFKSTVAILKSHSTLMTLWQQRRH